MGKARYERDWSMTNGGIAEKQNAAMYEDEARKRKAAGQAPTRRDNDTQRGEPPEFLRGFFDWLFDMTR